MLNSYIGKHIEARKDTFYRLKNNPSICWCLVLWLFATKFRKTAEEHGENTDCIKCIVFDDTLMAKTGRFIEKVSGIWDHVTGRFILGFKMLLMGHCDGTTFIPVEGALFAGIKEDIINHRLNERLWGLFIELVKLIETLFIEIDEDQLLERIINDEKAYEKLAIILEPADKKMVA